MSQCVGGALLVLRLGVLDDADIHSEEPKHRAHPLRVALRQVLVDGDHVHAVAAEGVQIRRQRRHQGLALAGAHLGDLAAVQRQAADQLDVEMPQSQLAARRLAHQRKRLGDQRFERRPRRKARLQLPRLFRKLLIGQRLHARLESVDGRHRALKFLDEALIAAAEYLRQKLPHAEGILKKLGIVRIDRKSGKSF